MQTEAVEGRPSVKGAMGEVSRLEKSEVVVAGGEREDLRSEKVDEEDVEEVDDVEEERERMSESGENIFAGVCMEDTEDVELRTLVGGERVAPWAPRVQCLLFLSIG